MSTDKAFLSSQKARSLSMPSSRFPFALSHPLSALLDKYPKDFTRTDFIQIIKQKGLERITFHYTALDGKLKELKLPVADEAQAEAILAEGERVDGSSLFKGMVETAMSDLYVVPVYSTAFLNPFDDRSLDFICRYFTKGGTLAPFAPDNILKRAADLFLKNTGLELRALGEIEFYLLSERGSDLFPAEIQKGYHNASPFLKSGPIVNEILSRITQITGAVKYAHGEVGYVDSVQSDLAEIKGKRAEQLADPEHRLAKRLRGDLYSQARGRGGRHGPPFPHGTAARRQEHHDRRLGLPIAGSPPAGRRALPLRGIADGLRKHDILGVPAPRSSPGGTDVRLLERPQSRGYDPRSSRLG
jgi:hypothetical protein